MQVLQLGSENARLQDALKRTEAERDSANKQLEAARAQLGSAGRDPKPAPRSGAASPVSRRPPRSSASSSVLGLLRLLEGLAVLAVLWRLLFSVRQDR